MGSGWQTAVKYQTVTFRLTGHRRLFSVLFLYVISPGVKVPL